MIGRQIIDEAAAELITHICHIEYGEMSIAAGICPPHSAPLMRPVKKLRLLVIFSSFFHSPLIIFLCFSLFFLTESLCFYFTAATSLLLLRELMFYSL